jgi:hypothetical protein
VTVWTPSHKFDPRALPLADRHYNRRKVGSPQFVPPGRSLVLLSENRDALWVSSYPFAEYVRHVWAGAWVCSLFRNESEHLSSALIREAVAITRSVWPVPDLGMVSFINTQKTRRKRDPGRCYLRAGFRPAYCPRHAWLDLILPDCPSCQSRTAGGLVAVQMLPDDMPDPISLDVPKQLSFFEGVA